MADINKKRSNVSRSDPEFRKMVDRIIAKNLLKGRRIGTSRVTLAIARQYKQNPVLLKWLEDADLK